MVQLGMLKTQAIKLLGGSVAVAATKLGVSYQAVDKWPDELPPRIADRVVAAVARDHLPAEVLALLGVETPSAKAAA